MSSEIPGVKVSALPSAGPLDGSEIIVLDQAGRTKTATVSAIRGGGFTLAEHPEAYETVLADANTGLVNPNGNGNNIYTIASNAAVPYPLGTFLTFINRDDDKTLVVEIDTDILIWAQDGTGGQRTIAPRGIATAVKTFEDEWTISGTGLS